MSVRLGAVILAAGESRRMGSPKPLLRLADRAFIEHVTQGIQFASPDEIVVVTSAALREQIRQLELGGVKIVVNQHVERGMAESLRCGLRALRGADAVLIALADHPRVRWESVARLGEAARENPDRIVIPVHRGESGHPVIIPRSLFDEIFALPDDQGLNAVIERHQELILKVDVDDPGVLMDIDTPDEYEKFGKGND